MMLGCDDGPKRERKVNHMEIDEAITHLKHVIDGALNGLLILIDPTMGDSIKEAAINKEVSPQESLTSILRTASVRINGASDEIERLVSDIEDKLFNG